MSDHPCNDHDVKKIRADHKPGYSVYYCKDCENSFVGKWNRDGDIVEYGGYVTQLF